MATVTQRMARALRLQKQQLAVANKRALVLAKRNQRLRSVVKAEAKQGGSLAASMPLILGGLAVLWFMSKGRGGGKRRT